MILKKCPKVYILETHRSKTPDSTLHFIENIRNLVGMIDFLEASGLDRIGIPVYTCHRIRPDNSKTSHTGKGISSIQAQVSLTMESIERYSSEFRDEYRNRMVKGSFTKLKRKHNILDPAELILSKESDYQHDRDIHWVWGFDLARHELLLTGRPVTHEAIIEITDEIEYRKGVRETIAALTARSVTTVILSTGLASLVDRVKRDLGITHAVANELIIEKGVATGGIRINVEHDSREGPLPILGSSRRGLRGAVRGGPFPSLKRKGSLTARGLDKGSWVRQILGHRTLKREEAAAVGDGEGDLGMFREVGLAIGYRPNELVASVVDHAFHNGSFVDILEVL